MTGAREFDVHCGGVPALAGKLEAIRLSASEPGRNMTVELSGLTKTLLADLSPRWHDLLFIAAYVLAAHEAVRFSRRDALSRRR